jgi:hypothetical protein
MIKTLFGRDMLALGGATAPDGVLAMPGSFALPHVNIAGGTEARRVPAEHKAVYHRSVARLMLLFSQSGDR